MIEILLVEDDPILGRGLMLNLEHEGYKLHWAPSLKSARIANQKEKFSLIILDVGLPDGSGFELLREIRQKKSRIPILILTAKTDTDSIVEGLQLGANDYVKKPFNDRELLARIKTALREPQLRTEQVRYSDLLVLVDQRQVLFGEKLIELSPREFDLLLYFLQHAESVVTREMLLDTFDKNGDLLDRSIDSNISHLRSRLRKAGVTSIQISSVYGVGYRLEQI